MPLIKRAVSPVDVSRGRIPPNLQHDELQCVANGTLANLIRQLSSLSKHAEHIFGEIYLEAMKLEHKSNVLEQRIERVRSKVSQLDSNNEQATLGEVQMRKAFKSSMLIDQHTLDRSTLPVSLTEAYTRCDRPPNLDALNPYRDDPNVNALSLYTNPSFFFDLWRQEMLKDVDTKRRVKSPTDGNKSPKKKRRAVPQQDPNRQASRYNTYVRAPPGALSFPEEYQAPQALGLQLNRPQNQYQQFQANSSLLPPIGMSVHAPPMDNKPQPPTTVKRDLPPPDLSLLSIDDDDDLPPPPPPLMHTSIVQQIPSPPQNNIQFVQSDNQMVPPPPPPPPPPLTMLPSTNAATFATSVAVEEKQKEEQRSDPRSDLLSQIRKGLELKKVRRAEEEEAERVATEQNDVAAILKRRMEHVLGNEDDSQSSECDDDEWED
ncbi:unnamed protein product [Auanema sp. JU1783]|nr:unnamed protein product [Auanema sp. JU1783]